MKELGNLNIKFLAELKIIKKLLQEYFSKFKASLAKFKNTKKKKLYQLCDMMWETDGYQI